METALLPTGACCCARGSCAHRGRAGGRETEAGERLSGKLQGACARAPTASAPSAFCASGAGSAVGFAAGPPSRAVLCLHCTPLSHRHTPLVSVSGAVGIYVLWKQVVGFPFFEDLGQNRSLETSVLCCCVLFPPGHKIKMEPVSSERLSNWF